MCETLAKVIVTAAKINDHSMLVIYHISCCGINAVLVKLVRQSLHIKDGSALKMTHSEGLDANELSDTA